MPPRDDSWGAVVELKEKLKGKILILGIGNPMKQDDGVGPALIEKLKSRKAEKLRAELIDAGSAPENYSGKIKQIKADTLVIVDAIDFGAEAGSIRVIGEKEIKIQSLSTHNVSLKTFVDFLKVDLPNLNVIIIGIQPKEASFGEGLSPEVEKAVDELCMSLG